MVAASSSDTCLVDAKSPDMAPGPSRLRGRFFGRRRRRVPVTLVLGQGKMSKKGIVIVCNLDTRGEDIVFVKQLIAGRGHDAILLDFSMEEPPPFPGDIRTEAVPARGGLSIDVVREKYRSDRDAATNNQIRGAAAIVHELVAQGRVHGKQDD